MSNATAHKTSVFVSTYPFEIENDDIFPPERKSYVDECKNSELKNQRFYAWKLLERALKLSFDMDMKDLKFVNQNGKWQGDGVCFSLSHTDGVCAVATSRNFVGIDIEKVDLGRFNEKLIDKILTDNEKNLQSGEMSQIANKLWTAKEAIFKSRNLPHFSPKTIDTTVENFVTKTIEALGATYVLSVAANDLSCVEFNFLGGLKEI